MPAAAGHLVVLPLMAESVPVQGTIYCGPFLAMLPEQMILNEMAGQQCTVVTCCLRGNYPEWL